MMSTLPRIRLVVLLQDLEFGGTQRYSLQLLRYLDRDRFAPELWVLRGGADWSPDGVKVVRLSGGRRVGPLALARLAWRLLRERPDLLYTLTVVPNIWGRLFAGLLGVPVVSGYRSLRPRQYERLLHQFSCRIITNAAALKEQMVASFGIVPDRISVVPNAVDPEAFAPGGAKSPTPLAVCLARRVPEKDLPTLLEAFRLLPDARLEIYGNGPQLLSPPPNVKILPAIPDVRSCLQQAWVFVLSSVSEASPNVILEAMAAGLPVVATRVAGIPELVVEGETGRLVPPRDPAALREQLASLLGDGALRRRMGEAGRQRVCKEFSVSRMVRRTEQVLLEVAQRGTDWTAAADGRLPLEIPLGTDSRPDRIEERGRFRPDRSYRQVGTPTLTAFLPEAERATGAAVVICPGGAYAGVSIDREGYEVARWLSSIGVAGLVLKYRLPHPGAPHPLEDAVRAMEIARQRSGEWRLSPQRIGLMGFSAGGHVAAATPAAFHVLVYPVLSMLPEMADPGMRRRLLGKRPPAEEVERYSMERHVTSQTPPTLLVHARDDLVAPVANSTVYAEALQRAGVAHELLLYECGGHGFGVGGDWTLRCVAWLQAQGFLLSA